MKRAVVGLALVTGFLACRQMLSAGWNDTDFTVDAAAVAVPETAGPVVIVGRDGKPVLFPVTLDHDALNPHTHLVLTRLDPASEGGMDDGGVPDGLTATLVRNDGGVQMALVADGSPATAKTLTLGVAAMNEETGQISAQQELQVSIAVVATVTPEDAGTWKEFVSTSLQPADFQQHIPDMASLAALTRQNPVHVQIYDSLWNGPSADAATWDTDRLDRFVTELVDAGQEVQLEIFTPPQLADDLLPTTGYDYDRGADDYAAYCAAIVAHFNGDGGVLPPGKGVHWWSIRGDDNTSSAPPPYVPTYNSAIAAMLKVDPTIQFVGPEASDQVNNVGSTLPGSALYPGYLTGFLNAPDAGGATQIDAIAVHMYSASLPTTYDQDVLDTVPKFGQHISDIRQDLTGALQDLPIWVTQTNVNSAIPSTAPDGSIVFHDNNETKFASDPRGTSMFFAAWEPYMFSQLGKAGNTGFFHWAYTAGHNADDSGANLDPQNAEVHYDPDDAGVYEKYVSYWVDYELSRMFPPDGRKMLVVPPPAESSPSVDVLATKSDDGSLTVMVTDIAPESDTAQNGGGLPRTVLVDLSQVIASCDHPPPAKVTTIDRGFTDLVAGPAESPASPAQPGCRYPVVLGGYGVAFLRVPVQP